MNRNRSTKRAISRRNGEKKDGVMDEAKKQGGKNRIILKLGMNKRFGEAGR